jgi:hypothetical protein
VDSARMIRCPPPNNSFNPNTLSAHGLPNPRAYSCELMSPRIMPRRCSRRTPESNGRAHNAVIADRVR